MDGVVNGVMNFSLSFEQTVALGDHNANVFFSPWSMATAFALVLAGARGKTKEQIADVFYWTSALNPDFHNLLGKLQTTIEGHSNADNFVKLANKIWLNKGYNVEKEFLRIAMKKYLSDVGSADFAGDAENARKEINFWVADHTAQKIQDLFPEGSVTPLTRLVLANAVYFKGSWKQPFDKEVTMKDDFYLNNGDTIKVDMMYSSDRFKVDFDNNARCTVVEIPYSLDSLSMLVIIPNEGNGISALEKAVDLRTLKKWSTLKHKMKIDFYMPKFKIEHSIELKDVLTKMGLIDVFTENADLSGISDTEKLVIGSAFHKAYIQVDEEGTEAAAATGIGIMALSMPPEVKANRPFLFFIKESKTGAILFSGKVMNPAI